MKIVIAIALSLSLVACDGESPSSTSDLETEAVMEAAAAAEAVSLAPQADAEDEALVSAGGAEAAKAALASEPKIKDLNVANGYWNVGVLDDGSNRTGYANYVCEVLRENGITGVTARVVDIVRVVNENASPRDASLGEASC